MASGVPTPETEVPLAGSESAAAAAKLGEGGEPEEEPLAPKDGAAAATGKKKRTFRKPENLAEFFQPQSYQPQKGLSKGGGKFSGKGKGDRKGPVDGESQGQKGKSKGPMGDRAGAGIEFGKHDESGAVAGEAMRPRRADDGPGCGGPVDNEAMQGTFSAGGKGKKSGGKVGRGDGGGRGGGAGKAMSGLQRGKGKGKSAAPRGGGALPGTSAGGCSGDAPDAVAGAPVEALDVPAMPQPPVVMPGKGCPAPGKGGPAPCAAGSPGQGQAVAPYGGGFAGGQLPCQPPATAAAAAAPVPYAATYRAMPAVYAYPYYLMPSHTSGASLDAPAGSPGQAFNSHMPPMGVPAGGPPQLLPQPHLQLPQPQQSTAERQQLKNQVQAQIEYYFGRENLIKDWFLRYKGMNEEGWVPITFLGTFPRLAATTTDMSIIMEAIASSQILELDRQSAQVRLKSGWQEWVRNPVQHGAGAMPAASPETARRG